MNSYISFPIGKPNFSVAIWSNEIESLFEKLLKNRFPDDDFQTIKSIFERFLIEMQDEKVKMQKEIESLYDRISDLEAMK